MAGAGFVNKSDRFNSSVVSNTKAIVLIMSCDNDNDNLMTMTMTMYELINFLTAVSQVNH